MNSLYSLSALTELFSGKTITLHAGRCLNARHRAVGCALCAEACPAAGAIVVVDGKPVLDNEACLQCGLCLHHCPTGAFTQPDVLSGKLVKIVAALSPGPVDLLCPQHPQPRRGSAPTAVHTRRCLAALSPATLLELSVQEHEIWLDDTPCAECPLGKTHPFLEQIVSEANGWGGLLENVIPISLRTEQDEDLPVTDRPIYEADRPPISRRGFFGSLKQLGQDTAIFEETGDPAESNQPVPVSERLPHFVPRQRAKLLSVIDQAHSLKSAIRNPQPRQGHASAGQVSAIRIPNSEIELPVADVTIDANLCSACGLCARFCPSGAITFLSDNEQFALVFRPALCLGQDCNICAIACPEEAVSTKAAAISPDLLAKKPLVAGELTPCQVCREPIATGPERPTTCFACRPRTTKMDLLKSLL